RLELRRMDHEHAEFVPDKLLKLLVGEDARANRDHQAIWSEFQFIRTCIVGHLERREGSIAWLTVQPFQLHLERSKEQPQTCVVGTVSERPFHDSLRLFRVLTCGKLPDSAVRTPSEIVVGESKFCPEVATHHPQIGGPFGNNSLVGRRITRLPSPFLCDGDLGQGHPYRLYAKSGGATKNCDAERYLPARGHGRCGRNGLNGKARHGSGAIRGHASQLA